jgi:hypothetical protein
MVTVLVTVLGAGRGASQPKTFADIALYQGPDREKILIEGDENVVLLNTGTELKYPETINIKVRSLDPEGDLPLIP